VILHAPLAFPAGLFMPALPVAAPEHVFAQRELPPRPVTAFPSAPSTR